MSVISICLLRLYTSSAIEWAQERRWNLGGCCVTGLRLLASYGRYPRSMVLDCLWNIRRLTSVHTELADALFCQIILHTAYVEPTLLMTNGPSLYYKPPQVSNRRSARVLT